ncbi:MAG: hypothetical protein RR933_07230, partial [Oscillospiraceae bacterium]
MVNFNMLENFDGLGKAIKIADDKKEMIVTLDVGPRIISFLAQNEHNIFAQNVKECDILPDGSKCNVYGGFRICHSPEAFPRTYISDSFPAESYEILEDGIIVTAAPEKWTNIQKILEVHFLDNSVKVISRLKNCGAWAINCSVWAISVCSVGSRIVCPNNKHDTGLLPNRHLVLWPYSVMNDERVMWGDEFTILDCNDRSESAFKFGCSNESGWAAAFNKNQCFVKRFAYDADLNYPDFGCNFEAYSTNWGIEMESLSPLKQINPDSEIIHEEE